MSSHRSAPWIVIAMLVAVHTIPAGAQQTTDTLRVEDAVAEALRANPRIRAARLVAEAATERISPAGTLPDPRLSLGLMNRGIRDFSTDPAMAMNSLQLSQRLPWPGKLADAEARSTELARAASLDAEEAAAAVAGAVRGHYYRMAYIDRAVAIMGRTVGLLRDLQEVATARYGVGEALQQDVLAAQVAAARVDADIVLMEERRLAVAARFNALLGRAPDEAVGALALPPVGEVAELSELIARAAEARPALQAAEARVEAARRARDVAERNHLPDFDVMLGYGNRPQFEDLLSLSVGVTLPVRRGSLQDPQRREAEALEASAAAMELDLYNETYARLAELRAAAVRSGRLGALYRSSIIPQAAAAVESGLSAYRVGSLDFQAVLQSRMNANQYEIDSVRLAAEHHEAMAGIGALIGGDR